MRSACFSRTRCTRAPAISSRSTAQHTRSRIQKSAYKARDANAYVEAACACAPSLVAIAAHLFVAVGAMLSCATCPARALMCLALHGFLCFLVLVRIHTQQIARANEHSKLNERTRAANCTSDRVQQIARETCAANCARECPQQTARQNERATERARV